MLSITTSMRPIETINWNALLPTYPFRFNGPGYLYCVGCEHFVRLVSATPTDFRCTECTKVLAINDVCH